MAASLAKIADIAQLVEREPSKLNVVGSLSAPFRVCLFHVTCARSRRRSGGVCAGSRGSWPRKCSAVGDPGSASCRPLTSRYSRNGFNSSRPCSSAGSSTFLVRKRSPVRYVARGSINLSCSSSGLGHKVFILVDRGSNPLHDAIFFQLSRDACWLVTRFHTPCFGDSISPPATKKEAQCSQERRAETVLKIGR